jgi:hypothetical protein
VAANFKSVLLEAVKDELFKMENRSSGEYALASLNKLEPQFL